VCVRACVCVRARARGTSVSRDGRSVTLCLSAFSSLCISFFARCLRRAPSPLFSRLNLLPPVFRRKERLMIKRASELAFIACSEFISFASISFRSCCYCLQRILGFPRKRKHFKRAKRPVCACDVFFREPRVTFFLQSVFFTLCACLVFSRTNLFGISSCLS